MTEVREIDRAGQFTELETCKLETEMEVVAFVLDVDRAGIAWIEIKKGTGRDERG